MSITRRQCLLAIPGLATVAAIPRSAAAAEIIAKKIPSTGEMIPVVGLGSWITFNVGNDRELQDECAEVMRAFFANGGALIDSSPMYGSSQATIGYGLGKLGFPTNLFAADKVWISSPEAGPAQIGQSQRLWGIPRFRLLQVHNLLSWEQHLSTLFEMKKSGQLDYVGITTSEGRRHGEVEKIMSTQPIDFIQVSYNVLDRDVEERILPLAAERQIAVIVNRPFRQGDLIAELDGRPLPEWLSETGTRSWPQLLLKFAVSHPSVTCAIPATSSVDHVKENMEVAIGTLMSEDLRRRLIDHIENL